MITVTAQFAAQSSVSRKATVTLVSNTQKNASAEGACPPEHKESAKRNATINVLETRNVGVVDHGQ